MTSKAAGQADGAFPAPDLSRLGNLLRLAGPDAGAELLARLRGDLAAVAEDLQQASAKGDSATLASATHVLISVAGSIGDMALSNAARAVNILAAMGEADFAGQALCQLRAGLQQLQQALPTGIDGGAKP